jgi:hypothetical protein
MTAPSVELDELNPFALFTSSPSAAFRLGDDEDEEYDDDDDLDDEDDDLDDEDEDEDDE